MRLGEILGLTWDDIDFENKKLTINKALQFTNEKGLSLETPKTTSSHRTILIPQSLIDELKNGKKFKLIFFNNIPSAVVLRITSSVLMKMALL